MGSFAFSEQFVNYFKTIIPGASLVSGGKELLIRCRYCMDSADPNHAHMYVHIPQSADDIPTFYCFKCHTSGVLDSRTLIEWGMYDPVMGNAIDQINKLASKRNKTKGYDRVWYNFYPCVTNRELAQIKVDYINQRLGLNLDISDCIKEKIVLNLKDSLDVYNLQYTRHPNIVNQLNDNFVGFLSLDSNFVNLRRIVKEGIVYEGIDKRYINYNIHDKKDNTEKMYVTMPQAIDLSLPQKVNIHIAEGPFDILSIKHNLRNNEPGIYAAVTGSGYKALLIHLLTAFKLYYFNVHLYPDNDEGGNDNIVRDIGNYIYPYGAQLIVHRNMYPREKDFGVSLDRIDERIMM